MIVAIAVAIVVIVVVFAVVGLLRPPSSTTVYGTPILYSQFISPAEAANPSAPGGPWTPFLVFGVGSGTSLVASAGAQGVGAGGCSPLWSTSSNFVLAATPAGAAVGRVSSWFLFSSDAAGNVLFTGASNVSGAIQAVALEVLPSGCLTDASEFGTLATSVVDSSVAAGSADLDGGTTFLNAHSGSTVELLLFNDTWAVVYTTCAFGASGGSGEAFLADLNATSAVVLTDSVEATAC